VRARGRRSEREHAGDERNLRGNAIGEEDVCGAECPFGVGVGDVFAGDEDDAAMRPTQRVARVVALPARR
jgi:hypothetical protein